MSDSKILHRFVQLLKEFRKLYYAPDKWNDLSEYMMILCDKDNSGNITYTELKHLTIAIGMKLTDAEQNSLFEVFNSTKNISIFGYKIFKEETISLIELQQFIKNDISE
jgi:Ca2+-binding EF-hand superfamily protein